MSARVLGMTHMHAGLNNQRIAVLGLVGMAYLEGARVALPRTLIDFTPLPDKDRHRKSPTIPFSEVFDEARLRDGLGKYDIFSDAPPTEEIPSRECFEQGNMFKRLFAFSDVPDSGIVAEFLTHCRAAEPLQDLSRRALAILGARPLMLQLRIERDWREYAERKYGFDDEERALTRPRPIFEKIARTPELEGQGRILACCDEDDLVEDRADLKAMAGEFGLDLIFKSEIERELDVPASRLKRSAIDFGICLLADRYVGLTRSSFSNMVCTLKGLETYPAHPEHYVYNAPGDVVLRRWDRGFMVSGAAAVTKPSQAHGKNANAMGDAAPLAPQDGRGPARRTWRELEIERLRREVTSAHRYRYEEIGGLRKDLASRDATIALLKARLDSPDSEILQLEEAIARLKNQVSEIREARNAKVRELKDRFDKIHKRQDATIAQLKAELASLVGSRSWRITAPFRMLSGRTSRLLEKPWRR